MTYRTGLRRISYFSGWLAFLTPGSGIRDTFFQDPGSNPFPWAKQQFFLLKIFKFFVNRLTSFSVRYSYLFKNRIIFNLVKSTGKWDLAEWLERLIANVKVVLGSIPALFDTMESEGRQMKQCWIKYIKKIQKIPLCIFNLMKFIATKK